MTRDHDGAELWAARAQVREESDAVGVGKYEIEDGQVRGMVGDVAPGLGCAPDGIGLETGMLEQLGERAPHARIILDEKSPRLGHRGQAPLAIGFRLARARSSSSERNGLLSKGRSVALIMATVSRFA